MLLRAEAMMRALAISGLAALGLAACLGDAETPDSTAEDRSSTLATTHITMHRTPTCGCCLKWVEHVEAEGFRVTVHDHADLTPIRETLGIPTQLASCHSARIGGYVLEGHVPASDIKRLLSERPDAVGLSVPGMPASAPGMDVEGVTEPFATLIFDAEKATVFSRHDNEDRE